MTLLRLETNEEDLNRYEWDFVDSPPNDYICPVCSEVLRKPMLTECCGSHVCEDCVTDLYQCPICNEAEFNFILDKRRWGKILELDVQCPLHNRGCMWTGELRVRGAHFDPLNGDCEYTDVDCTYGCGENLERNELAEHLEIFCPKRPSTCQYCKQTGKHEFITGDHTKECLEYPVQCPNNCGIQHIKQSNFEQHLRECPEQPTECDFSYAGCNIQIPRKDLIKHLQEDLHKHFSLQTEFFIKELERKDELLKQLAKKRDEQMEQIFKDRVQQLEDLTKEREQELKRLAEEKDRQLEELAKEKDQQLDKIDQGWKCKYKQLADNLERLTMQLWEADRDQLQLNTLLISGQFTEIWEGQQNKDKQVAIKRLRSTCDITPHDFMNEAHVLMNLHHKNIIQLYGVCTKRDPWYIVLEFMSQGNLLDYLHRNTTSIQLHQQISILAQIASGLDFLEKKNYIHRNIMARNMLVGYGLICKVSGFNLARLVDKYGDEYEVPHGEKVPIRWSAPEVHLYHKFSVKSDVWSFGILQYEVFTCGLAPYPGSSNGDVVERTVTGNHMSRPQSCPEGLYEIMLICWKMDPWSRSTFEVLLDQLVNFKMEDARGYTVVY